MTTAKREMRAVTFSPAAITDSGAPRVRDSVMRWLRKNVDDPIVRAARQEMKSKHRHADVIAILSKAKSNFYVEQVAIQWPLDQLAASVQLPSFPANPERAQLATLLLNCESAIRALVHGGSKFDGLFVAAFATGCSTADETLRLLFKRLEEERFRIGPPARGVLDEIRAKALTLVPARHFWRPDLKIAFAPPELALDLAAELVHIERWQAKLAAEHEGGAAAIFRSILEDLRRFPTMAAGSARSACNTIFDELARRIQSVSATLGEEGVEYKVEFRAPRSEMRNDSNSCEITRKKA